MLDTALKAVSVATGFWAAWFWWKASKVPVNPMWTIEPGDADLARDGWIAGMMEAAGLSSTLNARAALLTGLSVGAQALDMLVGLF